MTAIALRHGDLDTLKTDSVTFIERLLKNVDGTPARPYDKQIEVLRGIKRTTTICTGRQVGKTTLAGWDAVWFGTTHPFSKIWVIAPSLEQSRIMFKEIARHFRSGPLASLVDGKIRDFPFPFLKLKNGTEYAARGANSDQYIRGNLAHRAYVDEAGFIKDKVIGDVIEPMFTVAGAREGSALILTSTPFGQGTFRDYYEDGMRHEDEMASFHFTSLDNPHADKKFLERKRRQLGEDSLRWRTEYMGLFADSELRVFNERDLQWAWEHFPWREMTTGEEGHEQTTPLQFPISPQSKHKYVQGADLANQRDYFVSTLLDNTERLCHLVKMDRYRRRGYTAVKNTIRNNRNEYGHAKTWVDATSLGESVVEDLADINAEGWKFTSQSKAEVVNELVRMFSEQRLTIPYHEDIISELRFFEYKMTASKTLRMEAVKGHDDIVMSLALAAHGALIPTELGVMRGVSFNNKPKKTANPYDTSWFTKLFNEDEEDAA